MRAPTMSWLRYGLVANLVVLIVLAGYVLSQAYPSTEAARLRNALLIEPGAAADFNWTPEHTPASFLAELHAPLPEFIAAVHEAGADSATGDWKKALALAAMLTRNAQDKGAIQSDLVTTYRAIVEDGRGYCVDFVDAYLTLTHAAGLFAREWAFSFDGFGGDGHAFVEIFDRQRGKWVFVDVYNNVHAVDAVSGEPLSALELRDFALGRRPATVIRPNGPGRLGYPIESKLIDYYRRGAVEWYLWWGNGVFTYEAHPAVSAAGRVSRSLEQLVAIAVGVYPHIKVLTTVENAPQLERMIRLRWTLCAAAVLMVALLIALAAQVILLIRRGSTPRSPGDPAGANRPPPGFGGRGPLSAKSLDTRQSRRDPQGKLKRSCAT